MNGKKERLVIIGGVAAGMSAASRARRLRPDLEILVFEKSGYVSYAACGMPYAISGQVESADNLVVYDAGFFKERRNIDVFLHHEATKINPQRKSVLVTNIETGTVFEFFYDKLLIAMGARPFVPPMKGLDIKGIFTLRQLEEGKAIIEYIRNKAPRKGLILGAGYIGMEMAESFRKQGLEVTVVEKMPGILGSMDDEIAGVVEAELTKHGVRLIKSRAIVEFNGTDGHVNRAVLEDGEVLEADIALIGAGIRPNGELAGEAGIELNKGAIIVNERMETSLPDIYAAGDCAEAYHRVLGRNAYIPLGTTANKQGRVAGENMAGGDAVFAGIVGTAIFKVFDLEVGRTGITEKEAIGEGIAYRTGVVEHISRAHYYPDAGKIKIKLVSSQDNGRLLGAQLAGREGAAQRTNIFAAAITAGMTTREAAGLDLGYAPPLAPGYDPVIVAAEELEKTQ